MKTWITVAISLTLGFLFDYFFFEKIPGINFPLYVVLILVGLVIISHFAKKEIRREVFWLIVPLLFFSTMVAIRASYLLTFLNVVASLLLLLLIAEITFGPKLATFTLHNYLKIFLQPFNFLRPMWQTLTSLFSTRSPVALGIVISIPILVILVALFSSADLIFQRYVSGLISFPLDPELVPRVILILIATLGLLGAYSYTFGQRNSQIVAVETKTSVLGRTEGTILLGSVSILFLIFILIQLTYLFGGENNITAIGLTYAEYARRGFFELIAVAVIAFVLMFLTEKNVSKILSTALALEIILIMVSAFTRLSLYEEAYGYTTLRLYSHAFIIFLGVLFCLLLYKIYQDKEESFLGLGFFVCLILFLFTMNIINPDVFIARRNIEIFADDGKLDIQYLNNLSEDAILEVMPFVDVARFNQGDRGWQSLNLSRITAVKILTNERGAN